MAGILQEGPIRKALREKGLVKRSPEVPVGYIKVFIGERFPAGIATMVFKPLPPLTTSLDLEAIDVIELQTTDGRLIARYQRERV